MLRILIFMISVGVLLGCSESKEAREIEAKYRTAVERGHADVESAFKAWSDLTTDGKSVVLWSGATSQVLFVDFRPTFMRPYSGDLEPEIWTVWARSPGGTIYKTTFWLDHNLTIKPSSSSPEVSTMEHLLYRLHAAGRMDVIEKLGFPFINS